MKKLLFTLSLTVSVLLAQETSSDTFLLSETIKKMLTNNPKLQESIYNYMRVGKDLEIADHGYYPTLDLLASYGYEKVRSSSTNDAYHSGMRKEAQLTLTQNIYNGNATQSRIFQERSRLDAAAYSVAEQADRLSLQMTSAYLTVIKEKMLLDLAQENVSTHEEIYAQIKDRTESGFGRVSEQRQAGSRLTLAQSNLVAQENNYNDALNTFEKLAGFKVDAGQLTIPNLLVGLPQSEATIKEKAFTCNPSLLVQKANIALAQHLQEGAKAPFRPTLDFEAYARVGDDIAAVDGRNDSYAALLKLRYNLYNKGIDSLSKEKSDLLVQKEKEALETLKRDLNESLRFSWQSYVLNQKKLGFLEEHKNFSKETLEAYKEEFKIGRRDLINLLDAEGEYYSARREIVTTENDLLYAKYRLLDNMGLLSDSFEPGFSKRYIQGACSIDENL